MRKIVENFWFRLGLGVCSVIAGISFIIDPSYVQGWLIRIVGVLWVLEGLEHILAAKTIRLKSIPMVLNRSITDEEKAEIIKAWGYSPEFPQDRITNHN